MALDTSIPFRAIGEPVRLMMPQEHQQNALANTMAKLRMQEMESGLKDAEQARQRQNILSAAFADPRARNEQGDIDYNYLSRVQGIDPAQAMQFNERAVEARANAAKAKREQEKAQLEQARQRVELIGQLAGAATDQRSYDQGLATLKSMGIDTSGIPAQFDPAYVQQARTQALTSAQQIEQVWKQKGFDLDEAKFAETVRNNKAQNTIARGNLAVAQGNLSVRQQERQDRNKQPRLVYDSNRGVMIDPYTGQASPVSMPGGQPLPSKPANLKPIPAPANKAIVENVQNLRRAQQALALLKGEAQGGDPNAVGWKGYLPNTVLNRADPKGTQTRAAIADLGSLIIHDRSGAAVTAAESPRLMPFIPLPTDDAKTAQKKLERFVQIYQQETNDMADIYSEDQGYVPNPVLQRMRTNQPAAPAPKATGKKQPAPAAPNIKFVGFE